MSKSKTPFQLKLTPEGEIINLRIMLAAAQKQLERDAELIKDMQIEISNLKQEIIALQDKINEQ